MSVTLAFVPDGISMPAITPDLAVKLYRERDLETHPSVRIELEALRGKNLACLCPLNQPCQADFLLQIANS
jgi:Domain of unknown function (DUF4326)